MFAGKCANCEFWKRETHRTWPDPERKWVHVDSPAVYGICQGIEGSDIAIPQAGAAVLIVDDPQAEYLMTDENFGCFLYEPREGK